MGHGLSPIQLSALRTYRPKLLAPSDEALWGLYLLEDPALSSDELDPCEAMDALLDLLPALSLGRVYHAMLRAGFAWLQEVFAVLFRFGQTAEEYPMSKEIQGAMWEIQESLAKGFYPQQAFGMVVYRVTRQVFSEWCVYTNQHLLRLYQSLCLNSRYDDGTLAICLRDTHKMQGALHAFAELGLCGTVYGRLPQLRIAHHTSEATFDLFRAQVLTELEKGLPLG